MEVIMLVRGNYEVADRQIQQVTKWLLSHVSKETEFLTSWNLNVLQEVRESASHNLTILFLD